MADRIVIAKVDGDLWDLERPLEKSCKLELLDFEHPEGQLVSCLLREVLIVRHVLGKKVFWHSSAHVLGEAAEKHYGCHLCLGPPTDEGFFYEMAIDERPVVPTDYPSLETLVKGAIKDKQRFERLVMTKEDLLKMFEVRSRPVTFRVMLTRRPVQQI